MNKIKKIVVPGVYIVAICMFGVSLYYAQKLLFNSLLKGKNLFDGDTDYVDGEIIDNNNYLPVVSSDKTIIKPFTSDGVVLSRNFYDYEADSDSQESAIIYYENTYLQNSGVDYSSENAFDVVSILDGVVVDVKSDNVLGNIVEIRHSNDLISVYQSLSIINVKVDDNVVQGQIIGTSGKSNLNLNSDNNLHFELYYMGNIVNPIDYYDKSLTDL